jgi:hypothetical protein
MPSRHFDVRRLYMLKKMSVVGGMLIATAAGATMTSLPAFAQVPTGGGCCSGSHSGFGSGHSNRSWNGNETENFNHIRLHIRNRNNNIAVARPGGRHQNNDGLGVDGQGGL